MSASARQQQKAPRKGMAESAARPSQSSRSAWGSGARSSPTFSSGNSNARLSNTSTPPSQGAFPPLAPTNGARAPAGAAHDRVLQALAGLTGTTITLSTKSGQRYEGVISSTANEGDTPGVTLRDVKEISVAGAPIRDTLFVAATNFDTWQSGPADAKPPTNGDSFRTDTDISAKVNSGRERELQAWRPSGDNGSADGPESGVGDEVTFGAGANSRVPWDQFAVNESMFGVTTTFDEDMYTTKIDRSAAGYKERERNAQRLATEIMSGTSSNPHILEERSMNAAGDDSGVNEEDKYGAVVRGQNAYIPPGARKQQSAGATAPASAGVAAPKAEIPKVSVNGPDGTPVVPKDVGAKSPSPSPAPSTSSSNKPHADPVPAFRDFVTNERQRLTQKKQALVKSEMDKRKAELLKFSQTFKLNKPIPDDLVPILAKDEEKQKQIREKSSQDAASAQARSIGVTGIAPSPSASRMPQGTSPAAAAARVKQGAVATKATQPASVATTSSKPSAAKDGKPNGKAGISMYIQPIPPFKGSKTKQATPPANSPSPNVANGAATVVQPTSPTAGTRLNPNVSSFRPGSKGPTSPIPSTASASASASPKPKEPVPSNPFFGSKVIKKTPVHVKDDFNPFKHNKVAEASQITALWPYSGKRYIHMFPPLSQQPPQPPAQMPPQQPPQQPHGGYEDGTDQRQQQQPPPQHQPYVYAYPAYGYPGQMMPGMGHPPPGYMPFMQAIPYPPGMPPPNGQHMYASPMPQMPPPPGAYMPPPPGTYPPPPNGAGPRPSMPPTPIPAHAHPYYHQSPQMQHAVPYPMMMPPAAPGGPPHHYEAAPAPPPMGGVGPA